MREVVHRAAVGPFLYNTLACRCRGLPVHFYCMPELNLSSTQHSRIVYLHVRLQVNPHYVGKASAYAYLNTLARDEGFIHAVSKVKRSIQCQIKQHPDFIGKRHSTEV